MPPPFLQTTTGATCYLNALIQCLYHNVVIRNAILNIHTKDMTPTTKSTLHELSFTDRSARVIDAIQMTFTHMQYSNEAVYNLDILTDLLGLNTGEQQDLHELSNLLIAKIDSQQASELGKKDSSLLSISKLMNGQQQFSVTCQKCHHVSSRQETFCELDLAVEGQKSISDSLEQYFQEELLDGDNKYECSNCASRQEATRKTEIVTSPSVLSVQLRRNVYDMKTFQKIKLKTSIQYPPKLTIMNDTYKLTAVVYHRGASAYGGHYITEVLNWEDDQWWLCDDSTVVYSPHGPCKPQKKEKATSAAAAAAAVVLPPASQEVEVEDLTQEESPAAKEEAKEEQEEQDMREEQMRKDSEKASVDRRSQGRGRRRREVAGDSLQLLAAVEDTAPATQQPEEEEDKDESSGAAASTRSPKKQGTKKYDADCVFHGKAIEEYEHSHKLNRNKDAYMLLYVKEELCVSAPRSASATSTADGGEGRGRATPHQEPQK